MQKWCPEPLTVDPDSGKCFTPLAETHPTAEAATAAGFRPEAGFADVRGLLAALSHEERGQIIELIEQDLRREYDERAEAETAAQKEAEETREREAVAARERWHAEFAQELRREIEDSLTNLAGRTVEMARLMAEKVIRREVTVDTEVLVRAIETVLYKAEAGVVLSVTVHPDDAAWLKEQPELRERLRITDVKADRRLERGGCVVGNLDQEWDATVERQLSVLSETLDNALLLPADGGSPDPEVGDA